MAVTRVPRAALLLLLVLGAAPPVRSQPAPAPDEVRQLIARLDHDSYRAREEAARRLAAGGPAVRPAVLRALTANDLSPEGRARLQRVADELIGFRVLDSLAGVRDAEFRLGSVGLFVLDTRWDLERFRRLLPKLPDVDPDRHSLLVAVFSPDCPRAFLSPTCDGDTLVVRLSQDPPPRLQTGFTPSRFAAARVDAWPGPIRFEVNGRAGATLWRGDRLAAEAARQWAEVRRLAEGGEPSPAQRVAARRQYWGAGTPDALIGADLKDRPISRQEREDLLEIEFQALAELRARPAVADLFRLVERLKQHDPALKPAEKALVAIGGPEVVAGCHRAIRSENRVARGVAVGVACDLGLPELRPLFRRAVADVDDSVARGGMNGLDALGWEAGDVPALAAAVDRAPERGARGRDVVEGAAGRLADLGRASASALPPLGRLRDGPDPALREAATAAIDRIRAAAGGGGREK